MSRARWILAFSSLAALASDDAVERLKNTKLTIAQRNDACYELRSRRDNAVLTAMRDSLTDETVRACAARSLVASGAREQLREALADENPHVRAIAADSLGQLKDPADVARLAKIARDPSPAVGLAALNGLAHYPMPLVVDALIELGQTADSIGWMALEQALPSRDPRLLQLARERLSMPDIPSRLSSIRIIAALGDASDISRLKPITAATEEASASGRGFGFLPAINLARVARTAIAQIEARQQSVRREGAHQEAGRARTRTRSE